MTGAAHGRSLFGRSRDLDRLAALASSGVLSLTGPGGIGKSTLAAALLRRLEASGVATASCPLVGARRAADLARAVSATLGVSVRDPSLSAQVEAVGRALADRGRLALLLDGFEAVLSDESVAMLARWCHRAPRLLLVVTSRAWLSLSGEIRYEVGPLATGGGSAPSPAAALFFARSGEDGAADPARLARVEALVARVEGLPLAVEVLAAMAASSSIERVAARLEEQGEPGAEPTLDARRAGAMGRALAASWRALAPDAQSALAQAAVFAGGFDLDAAEAVIDLDGRPVDDALLALVQASLLRVEPGDDELRYVAYDVVRAFATAQLRARDPAPVLARHAAWYLDRDEVDEVSAILDLRDDRIARTRRDLPQFVAIQRRALAASPPRVEEATRAFLRTWPVWRLRGAHLSLVEDCDRLAALWRAQPPPTPRARLAHYALGQLEATLAMERGAVAEGDALLAGLRDRLPAGPQPVAEALMLSREAVRAEIHSELPGARRLADAAWRAARSAGPTGRSVAVLAAWGRARVALQAGDARAAIEAAEAGLAIARARGEGARISALAGVLGEAAGYAGDDASADRHLRLAVDAARLAGAGLELGSAWRRLHARELARGRLAEAEEHLERAIAERPGDLAAHKSDAGQIRYELAVVRDHQQRYDAALADFRHAARIAPTLAVGRVSAARAAILAVWIGEPGARDAAEAAIDALGGVGLPGGAAMWRVGLDLAADAPGAVERAAAWLERTRRTGGPAQVVAELHRLVERDLMRRSGDPRALLVDPRRFDFRPPGGEWASLGRRRIDRALLGLLVEARCRAPGHPVTLDRIAARVWPETPDADPATLRNRAHVALHQLRRAGLAEAIATHPEGWLLPPELPVLLCAPALPGGGRAP